MSIELNAEPNESAKTADLRANQAAVISVAQKEALLGMVRANNSQNRIILILGIGLVIVSVLCAVSYFRRPKVLVAVQTPDGQRIAKIDDVNFGATDQIQMGEDNLSNADKRELVENFLQSFYAVDLASRSKDVPRALKMITPAAAAQLYKNLNEQGILQRERDEGWSATWTTDSFEVDRSDRNLASVIGTQILRRNSSGRIKQERVQYKILFQLYTEGKRETSPLRTGYWIANFKPQELSRSEVN